MILCILGGLMVASRDTTGSRQMYQAIETFVHWVPEVQVENTRDRIDGEFADMAAQYGPGEEKAVDLSECPF